VIYVSRSALGLGRGFRFQVADVSAVRLRERRAFNEENVLGVKLTACLRLGRFALLDQ
jgi:hypothetical protein